VIRGSGKNDKQLKIQTFAGFQHCPRKVETGKKQGLATFFKEKMLPVPAFSAIGNQLFYGSKPHIHQS
jgi:hypothetical protein